MNEYLYSVTSTNDSDTNTLWVGRYSNALDAVNVFNSFIDYGDANEYRVVNLSEPSGKLHTKTFYTTGMVVSK
jgi:hypothetical protein